MKTADIYKRGGIAISVFLLLTLAWPVVQPAYTAIFRSVTQRFFVSPSSKIKFVFERLKHTEKGDVLVYFYDKEKKAAALKSVRPVPVPKGKFMLNSWYLSYLPLCLLLSLIVATPLSRKRKYKALAWSCGLMFLFITVKLYVCALFYMNAIKVTSWEASAFFSDVIRRMLMAIVLNTGINATIPVLIWILVTFSKSDYQLFQNASLVSFKSK